MSGGIIILAVIGTIAILAALVVIARRNARDDWEQTTRRWTEADDRRLWDALNQCDGIPLDYPADDISAPGGGNRGRRSRAGRGGLERPLSHSVRDNR